MMSDIKTRLKSLPLWAAVLSLIYLITKEWLGFELPGWADISTQILAILSIVLGVANNPTSKTTF